MDTATGTAHPILAAVSAMGEELKTVGGVNPTFMATGDKAVALRELVALESRLVELRLRVMAAAGDLADETGARDVAAWLTAENRVHTAHAAADLRLATVLARDRPLLAAGIREGTVNTAQARVIDAALGRLWAPTPRSSTWAAPPGCTTAPNARPCSCATAPAAPRAATSPGPGPRPTTGSPGPNADPPPSRTASCSAPITTTARTTPDSTPNDSHPATSDSTAADRPTQIALTCLRGPWETGARD